MQKNFTILSLKKYHTFEQLKEQQLHNTRAIKLPNVDYNMSVFNQNLINGNLDYSVIWKNRIRQAESEYGQKIKVRKNAVIAFELVLSFSNEQTSNISIDDWCKENVEWLKENFGEENILAATLHMDETTPHIHAEIIPIDKRGHLCAKTFTAGRQSMFQLQDSYAKAMGPFGLIRGKKYTKSKKKELNEFYKAINRISEEPVPKQLDEEDIDTYLKRLEEYLKTLQYAYLKTQLDLEQLQNNYNADVFNEFLNYQDAIDLQLDLEEQYDNKEFALERLQDYRIIEKTVPKVVIDKVIKQLKEKYPAPNNILSFLPNRKEKRIQKLKQKHFSNNTDISI